jgi:hypothetical protein
VPSTAVTLTIVVFSAAARQKQSSGWSFWPSSCLKLYGLTLQSGKTSVIDVIEYRRRFSLTPERVEAESLEEKFEELLERAGVDHEYGESIDYDDLPADVQAELTVSIWRRLYVNNSLGQNTTQFSCLFCSRGWGNSTKTRWLKICWRS